MMEQDIRQEEYLKRRICAWMVYGCEDRRCRQGAITVLMLLQLGSLFRPRTRGPTTGA